VYILAVFYHFQHLALVTSKNQVRSSKQVHRNITQLGYQIEILTPVVSFEQGNKKMFYRFVIRSSRVVVGGGSSGCSPLIVVHSKIGLRSLSTTSSSSSGSEKKKGLPRTSAGGDNLLPVSIVLGWYRVVYECVGFRSTLRIGASICFNTHLFSAFDGDSLTCLLSFPKDIMDRYF
jgi:hypothetical protein